MYELMVIVFVIGYICITIEHKIKIDKAAIALVTGILCWTIYVSGKNDIVSLETIQAYAEKEFKNTFHDEIIETSSSTNKNTFDIVEHYVTEVQLFEILGEISSILFFLMGAMTIVELIDLHGGFRVVTSIIKTTSKFKLLWIFGFIAFFFSAILDNLTTSIIMVSLTRKFILDKKERWLFLGLIIKQPVFLFLTIEFNNLPNSFEVKSSKLFAIVNRVKGLYSRAVILNLLKGKISLSRISSSIFRLIILFDFSCSEISNPFIFFTDKNYLIKIKRQQKKRSDTLSFFLLNKKLIMKLKLQ